MSQVENQNLDVPVRCMEKICRAPPMSHVSIQEIEVLSPDTCLVVGHIRAKDLKSKIGIGGRPIVHRACKP